ncbi:ABC-three component system middle component 5 [Marinobacter mangrovi]|uniref:ABC-three component system middle component 5 n=1 Tax=Marinobacter mangrovi TaxID=2803918 RepID=UPI0019343F22|nr:ABC-three component system middle component 5 [Marinobacter mangrovi]
MILYHPAYDAYHCSYRILSILYFIDDTSISHEMIRFIDFYYLYPHLLKRMGSLPRPLNYKKKIIDKLEDPFEITPNPRLMFYELGKTQESVLKSLEGKLFVNSDNGLIKLNIESLSERLIESFNSDEFLSCDFFKMLLESFPKVNLDGPNGFKSKSGLMEFRYG